MQRKQSLAQAQLTLLQPIMWVLERVVIVYTNARLRCFRSPCESNHRLRVIVGAQAGEALAMTMKILDRRLFPVCKRLRHPRRIMAVLCSRARAPR